MAQSSPLYILGRYWFLSDFFLQLLEHINASPGKGRATEMALAGFQAGPKPPTRMAATVSTLRASEINPLDHRRVSRRCPTQADRALRPAPSKKLECGDRSGWKLSLHYAVANEFGGNALIRMHTTAWRPTTFQAETHNTQAVVTQRPEHLGRSILDIVARARGA